MANITRSDLESSIETFATLLGRLSLPFADRQHELAMVGLESEVEVTRLETSWAERFTSSSEAEKLVNRFAEAHESARKVGSVEPQKSLAESDPRFLTPEAQAWRSEAAAVSLNVSAEAPPLLAAPPIDTLKKAFVVPP